MIELPAGFPIDAETGEPQLLQLPYRDDEWLFLAACVHLIRTRRSVAEPHFRRFEERWPTPQALADTGAAEYLLLSHFVPLGLHGTRSHIMLRQMDGSYRSPDDWPGYPWEAWRVLALRDVEHRADDRIVEAWRRWATGA